MNDFAILLITFVATLSVVLALSLLAHWIGKRPDYPVAVALAVGITAARATGLVWPLSDRSYTIVLATAVGLSYVVAKIVTMRLMPNHSSKRTREKPHAA